MRVKIPGRTLHAAIKAAGAVAKPNDDRQILRNILLVADETGLEITATDTIVSLWLKIPIDDNIKVEKPGRVAVDAQQFQRVLDTVANRNVILVNTDRNFQVRAGRSRFKLCVEDASDFPRIARFSSRKPFITVSSELIPKMIARTAFCAHDESSFQLMHGLLVKAEKNELRMVATNGQRLSITTMPFETQSAPDVPFSEELVVPAEFAELVKKIVGTQTKTIDIQWMASFLNFRTDVGEISLRALAGNFPAYGLGIPSDLRQLKVDRKDFIEILKQATALKSPTTNFVSLTFNRESMIFHSVAEGAGESEIEYEYAWDDDPLRLTVNPDFMLETLTHVRGDDIGLEIGNEMTPTILRECVNDEKIKSFCVYAVVRQ